MLEKVDLGRKLSKERYKEILPKLQSKLYDIEHALFQAGIPVVIVFEGWAAAGKGSTINVLTKRLDPRGFRAVPVTPPRTAEMGYPWLRRYWLKIPAYGQTVVFDTSWYRRVLIDRVGKLTYLGGLHLASPDQRFGGLSGLAAHDAARRTVGVYLCRDAQDRGHDRQLLERAL